MKTLILFLICNFQIAIAQITFKTNLLHPIAVQGASLAVEVKATEKSTSNFYFSFANKMPFVFDKYEFYALTYEHRFYPFQSEKAKNIFVAPYVRNIQREFLRNYDYGGCSTIWCLTGTAEKKQKSIGGGLSIGTQFPIHKSLVLDIFGATGWNQIYRQEIKQGDLWAGFMDFRVGVSVGFPFLNQN